MNYIDVLYNLREQNPDEPIDSDCFIDGVLDQYYKNSFLASRKADGTYTERACGFLDGFWEAIDLISFLDDCEKIEIQCKIDEFIACHIEQ